MVELVSSTFVMYFSWNRFWNFEISTNIAGSKPHRVPCARLNVDKRLHAHKLLLESSFVLTRTKREDKFHCVVSTCKKNLVDPFCPAPRQSFRYEQINTIGNHLPRFVLEGRALCKKVKKDVHAWDGTDHEHYKELSRNENMEFEVI